MARFSARMFGAGMLLLLLVAAMELGVGSWGFAKVAPPMRQGRASLDLSIIRSALDRYATDWGEFPRPDVIAGDSWLPMSLTTPVSYLKELPSDPWAPKDSLSGAPNAKPATYRYWLDPRPRRTQSILWVVASRGPDGAFDFPPLSLLRTLPRPAPASGLSRYAYDPTNGASSRGDLMIWAER